MKIIYVESNTYDGHHLYYLNKLVEGNEEARIVVPKKIEGLPDDRQYIVGLSSNRKFFVYRKWMSEVYAVIKKEKPDIVHFLYGDVFYRFFGFGLKKKYKTIVTFHQVRHGKLRDVSIKRIFRRISLGIVHTAGLLQGLRAIGIQNIAQVEYPNFTMNKTQTARESKAFFSLPEGKKVIGAIGGTRRDKGLDILLEALRRVQTPFHLLIAGAANSFDEAFIKERISDYQENVTLHLKYLDDDEYYHAVNASDIVALPYRRVFDGASGPLTDGAVKEKTILGPSHGSLGKIIKDYHLGYTFESENVDSLSETIERALSEDFAYDDKAKEYVRKIDPERFKKNYLEIYDRLA